LAVNPKTAKFYEQKGTVCRWQSHGGISPLLPFLFCQRPIASQMADEANFIALTSGQPASSESSWQPNRVRCAQGRQMQADEDSQLIWGGIYGSCSFS
jgi:hypothetical protein